MLPDCSGIRHPILAEAGVPAENAAAVVFRLADKRDPDATGAQVDRVQKVQELICNLKGTGAKGTGAAWSERRGSMGATAFG